ncbi:MAG: TauD/TfdA family dioxygenase [Proteobacteria bacterium]|nr:TauD/TfdA family dioxygenase [Burkholderiales bacterium]
MALAVRPLSYALGAEVLDVDLSRPLTESRFGEIYRAFLDHGILLLRGQKISREQHIEFSRRFGELDRHDSLPRDRHPEYPELLMVSNLPQPDGAPSNSRYTGQLWHSDLSFTLMPSLGSLLRGVEVPPVGGDTMFANMYLAYDALSAGMKGLIADLHGVHSPERKNAGMSPEWEKENRLLNPPVAQPVVRVHPETGRKALYIGEKVKAFEGMTDEESVPLIDYLIRHSTRPQFLYRHQWRPDDIVIWDNRCTMHVALGDYDPTLRRHMERTTVMGTPSGHVASDAVAH